MKLRTRVAPGWAEMVCLQNKFMFSPRQCQVHQCNLEKFLVTLKNMWPNWSHSGALTCLAIRAVHIEVASSLDTDSFIIAFRHFTARRGQVRDLCSDNGTNFVGAEQELRSTIEQWNQERIHNVMMQRGIQWRLGELWNSWYSWEKAFTWCFVKLKP